MEIVDIAELNFNTDSLQKRLVETRTEIDGLAQSLTSLRKVNRDSRKEIDELTKANEDLAKSGKSSSKEFEENNKRIEELNKTISKNTNEIVENESKRRNLNKEQRELNKVLDLQNRQQKDNNLIIEQATKLLDTNYKTQNEAREAELAMLAVRKDLNPEIAEEAKLMEELSKEIDNANRFQKIYISEEEKRVSGIGKYKEAITEALRETNLFGKSTGSAGKGAMGFVSGLAGATKGMGGLTSATLSFTSIPLVAIVSSLVKGFQFLYERFGETQKGMDAITRFTRPLSEVFNTLIGIFQRLSETIGSKFTDAFNNPLEALKNLGEVLLNNVINRFKAFAVIWNSIKEGDIQGAIDGAIQLGTGFENVTKRVGEYVDDLGEAIERGKEIDRITKDIEANELELSKLRSDAKREIDEITEGLRDSNKTYAEREVLANKRLAVQESLAKLEQEQLDRQIKLFDLESIATDTGREDELKRQELLNKRNDIERDTQALRNRNQRFISGAIKEQQKEQAESHRARLAQILEEQKAELDYFVLVSKAGKESLQEELDFEKSVHEQKMAILEQEYANKIKTDLEYRNEKAKLDIELAKSQAEISLFYATQELNEEIKLLVEFEEDRKRITSETLEEETLLINSIASERIRLAKERLDADLINRHEYNELVYEAEKEQLSKINELNKEFEEQKSNDEKLRLALEHEERLLNIETQWEEEREILEEQKRIELEDLEEAREEGLISEENYQKQLQLIRDFYAKAEMDLDKKVTDNKLQLISGVLGDISALMGAESTAGKFFASAQALISTYLAAQEAFRVGVSIGGPPVGFAFASVATATGLANVAKINKVKTERGGKQLFTGGVAGYTGNSGKYSVAGTVHGGEVVFSREDVRLLGGADRVDRMRPTASNMPFGGRLMNKSDNDSSEFIKAVADAVYEGSNKGTNSGMVQLSDDIDVINKSVF